MWILAVFGAMLSIFVAHSVYNEHVDKAIPWNASEINGEMARFHTFAAAAEVYMRNQRSKLPAGTQVVRWADYVNGGGTTIKGIGNAAWLPSTLAGTPGMDPNWRIQITDLEKGNYLLCARMSIAAVGKVANLPEHGLWNPALGWTRHARSLVVGGVTKDFAGFDASPNEIESCQ